MSSIEELRKRKGGQRTTTKSTMDTREANTHKSNAISSGQGSAESTEEGGWPSWWIAVAVLVVAIILILAAWWYFSTPATDQKGSASTKIDTKNSGGGCVDVVSDIIDGKCMIPASTGYAEDFDVSSASMVEPDRSYQGPYSYVPDF